MFFVFYFLLSSANLATAIRDPFRINGYRSLPNQEVIVFQRIFVEIGDNVGSYVKRRIQRHLGSVESEELRISYRNFDDQINESASNISVLFISLGNASLSNKLIPQNRLEKLPWESYQLIMEQHHVYPNTYTLAVNGLPLDPSIRKNVSFNPLAVNYGAIAGSYAALEMLGFAFLHPLDPFIPPVLRFHRNCEFDEKHQIVFQESPYWPQRAFHIHTQHPLELTEVLQGHDIPQFGTHGPHCREFSELSSAYRRDQNLTRNSLLNSSSLSHYCERWEDMLIDVDSFYEWSIANGLNMIEWLLLGNYKWGDELSTRFYRFQRLTHLGHHYSLLIGADVPIGNIQQHGWYMVNVRLPIAEQKKQIRDRIDWIFHAGFDFLTTESGLSEFTHPECDLMLDLFNTFAKYINETWQRAAAVKVHCSTGQSCSNYLDSRTGDPLNFNFLPSVAHPGLGVFPHTVQMYAFDDPTAGSYGNENFRYMEDYLVAEGKAKKRSVLFYGETAYWVNVDIDVPLFLPIYGQRRLKDLRTIAFREQSEQFQISGQMNFDSGWEYGYWLNDVVTARASWHPQVSEEMLRDYQDCLLSQQSTSNSSQSTNNHDSSDSNGQTDHHACLAAHSQEWVVYASSLQIFTQQVYGRDFGARLTRILVELTQSQAKLLIRSEIRDRPNPNLRKLSGIAYLSGCDTWTEIPRLLGLSFTQPDKVHLSESEDQDWPYVMELLMEIEETIERHWKELEELAREISEQSQLQQSQKKLSVTWRLNQSAMDYLQELRDALELLLLRARQVRLLYESNDQEITRTESPSSSRRAHLLEQSRSLIHQAMSIVRRRESLYRVAWQRIAAWRENPTVYRFGYLWAVHSLFYWWRDQSIAEALSRGARHSPCYLNRMDSTEVAVGWGKYTLEWIRYLVTHYTPFASVFPLEIVNCLTPPSHEYEFPRDL